MPSSNLIRTGGGLASAAAGLLLLLGHLLDLGGDPEYGTVLGGTLVLTAHVVLAFAIVALYAAQAEQSGLLRASRVREVAHARASSRRSFPQKSSPLTTKLGAPKIPSSPARRVCPRRNILFSGARACSTSRSPDRPRESRISRISTASPISRSSAKLALKTARTNSGSHGSDFARQATRAASRPSRGKREGLANGIPYPSHSRSRSRHM